MDSQESENISQFTTDNSTANPGDVVDASVEGSQSWGADVEIEIPEVLKNHMAKDCSAVRCFNCECPGHRAQECKDSPRCSVCLADNHSMPQCPFLLFSANVDSEPTPPKTEKEKKQERAQRAKEREERQKKLQQQREQQRQQEEQQKLLEKQEQQEQQKQQDQEKQREQQRDEGRRERPRERRDERGRDDRRERDRSDRDYYRGRDDRDRSSRRDYSGSETDDDGWERVKPRRRRYRY